MKIIINETKLKEEYKTLSMIDEEIALSVKDDFYKGLYYYKELVETYRDTFMQYRKYYKSDIYKVVLNRGLSQYLYYLNCLKKLQYVEKIVKE